MRRTPLTRRTPMRRSKVRTTYRVRERSVPYMLFVKTLPCCAGFMNPQESPCSGAVEADHAGLGRGLGEKAHDSTVIPMCQLHHAQRHAFAGLFKTWDRGQMGSWLVGRILNTQRMARARGVPIPQLMDQVVR